MANHESTAIDADHIERQTAPQQPYTMRDVGVGIVVAIVGLAIVFGVPILTTL
ncbi:DUF7550 family protein [Halocatena pleomorpha]|uniref:DUF7550 family protein n=1 Tax=Halocatena pleomorpha TaxID=1785090 RepID=UPI00163B028B|nr:hypothetical protein [Halocatena pleomorpha]